MGKMMIALVLAVAVTGCATTKPKPVIPGPKPPVKEQEPYMLKSEEIKEAIREAVIEIQKQMEENFKRKIQVNEKAKVEVSTVEVVSAKWGGLIFRSIGDVELSFTISEKNGVSVEFERYDVRVVCKYSSFFRNKEANGIGHFYFDRPVIVEAGETKTVSFKTNGWVRKTINSMNEKLYFEEIKLHLVLYGEDANGNKISITTETAPI